MILRISCEFNLSEYLACWVDMRLHMQRQRVLALWKLGALLLTCAWVWMSWRQNLLANSFRVIRRAGRFQMLRFKYGIPWKKIWCVWLLLVGQCHMLPCRPLVNRTGPIIRHLTHVLSGRSNYVRQWSLRRLLCNVRWYYRSSLNNGHHVLLFKTCVRLALHVPMIILWLHMSLVIVESNWVSHLLWLWILSAMKTVNNFLTFPVQTRLGRHCDSRYLLRVSILQRILSWWVSLYVIVSISHGLPCLIPIE